MFLTVFLENPILGIIMFACLVLAIGLHEAAHAFTAVRLGDNTPVLQGRKTLNPIKHLDPIGTLMIIFVGIGWGKPVQFNPYNLKNPRKDAMKIAIAGPLTNLVLAAIGMILLVILNFNKTIVPDFVFINNIVSYFIILNLTLAVFNLMPIEPLDGFKVVSGLLPYNLSVQWQETARYGMFILIALLITGLFDRIMNPVINFATFIIALISGI